MAVKRPAMCAAWWPSEKLADALGSRGYALEVKVQSKGDGLRVALTLRPSQARDGYEITLRFEANRERPSKAEVRDAWRMLERAARKHYGSHVERI